MRPARLTGRRTPENTQSGVDGQSPPHSHLGGWVQLSATFTLPCVVLSGP